MKAQSWILIVLLTGVAGLALYTTHRHYAQRDAESAIVSLMTHRFDGTTRSRLNTWLERQRATRAQFRTSTHTELPGPFSSQVEVTLDVDGATYRFFVGIRDRIPAPADAATRAFIQRLRDELAQPQHGK